MNKKFSIFTNSLLVLVFFLLSLSVTEIFVRIFLKPSLYCRYVPKKDSEPIKSKGIPNAGFYKNTPLGMRLKENADGVVFKHFLTGTNIPLRTNKFGFRGPEIVFDDRIRVLFLGDSITLADYLFEEDTFIDIIKNKSRQSDIPLQTMNAGVGSIGIEEEFHILRETGDKVDPQIVVLNLYINDAQSSQILHLIPISPLISWSRLVQYIYQTYSIKQFEQEFNKIEYAWKRQATARYLPGHGDWHKDRPAYNQMMLDWFSDWGSSYSEGGQQRILRFSQLIIDLCKSLNAVPLIVIHPTSFQVETKFNPNEPQLCFIDYFNKIDVPVLDLLPIFRSHYELNNKKLFYDHCHHNIEGAALVAEHLYPFISQTAEKHFSSIVNH